MTLDVENCHSTVHIKQANLSMFENCRSFELKMKESIKRTTEWVAYYHTSRRSWYPKPEETIPFSRVPTKKKGRRCNSVENEGTADRDGKFSRAGLFTVQIFGVRRKRYYSTNELKVSNQNTTCLMKTRPAPSRLFGLPQKRTLRKSRRRQTNRARVWFEKKTCTPLYNQGKSILFEFSLIKHDFTKNIKIYI